MQTIRPPAVAGAFYPADPRGLQAQVARLLQAVDADAGTVRPKALIAPHAGYVYSGPTAAVAYARLRPWRDTIERVVLLGPAHRVWLEGLALPSVEAFATPLGEVALDAEAIVAIRDLPQVSVNDAAHAGEHALEVHLPFLQSVLGRFRIVPLVVGRASPAQVSQVLERIWGGDETLIVVSSDLSHYLRYDEARAADTRTTDRILARQADLDPAMACGAVPVNGLLSLARSRGLTPQLLDRCNSGDTAGDRQRVVGYAAFAFYPNVEQEADTAEGKALLAIARGAIASSLGLPAALVSDDPALDRQAATFITLKHEGQLRGCIGSLTPRRSLRDDVAANARAAAFEDPRFGRLRAEEMPGLSIEVSLLSPLEPLHFDSDAELIAQLRPGIDGVVLEHGGRRGTFLPQVWESLPDPAAFLAELKHKAGLPRDFRHPGLKAWRYGVTKWTEDDTT